MSIPGMQAGRSDSIVELVDMFPTVSELVGLPVPSDLQGVSLVPVLQDPTANVKQGALSFTKGTSWRNRDWAYMRYSDGSEELYDMRRDPEQFTNLAKDDQFAAVRRRMSDELTAQQTRFQLK